MQYNPNQEALRAKADADALARMMRAYRPLMIAAVHLHMHGFRDEYLQIAEDAFCEAIRAYNPDRGSFLPLFRRIMRMRLIDERRRIHSKPEIPMADLSDETNFLAEQQASMHIYRAKSLEAERREEIQEYAAALQQLGISLHQVQQACPRHKTTRELCLQAIALIRQDPDLYRRTIKGRLPIAALCTAFATGDKIWERHRRYLIAAAIAISGDYPHIESFVLPKGGIA